MSVQHDASGRRWVQVEVEVPGTPEEVWRAIATGPGVSSWFVPCQVDELPKHVGDQRSDQHELSVTMRSRSTLAGA